MAEISMEQAAPVPPAKGRHVFTLSDFEGLTGQEDNAEEEAVIVRCLASRTGVAAAEEVVGTDSVSPLELWEVTG